MYSFEKEYMEKSDKEKWSIITYPGIVNGLYSVSTYGRIRNNQTNKILSLYPLVRDAKSENVYYIIKLKYIDYDNTVKYKNYRVNRLVAWEFCENRELSNVVMHLNDNKLDNYYLNLKWGTRGENTRDAIKTNRLNISCSNNLHSVYDEEFIHYICKLMEDGKSNKEILLIISGENATIRKNSKEWSLISHLRAKDRYTDIAITYNYTPLLNIRDFEKNIIKELIDGKENIDIMYENGYNSISENPRLYSSILKCRKIIKICSTTRERQLLENIINN